MLATFNDTYEIKSIMAKAVCPPSTLPSISAFTPAGQ